MCNGNEEAASSTGDLIAIMHDHPLRNKQRPGLKNCRLRLSNRGQSDKTISEIQWSDSDNVEGIVDVEKIEVRI